MSREFTRIKKNMETQLWYIERIRDMRNAIIGSLSKDDVNGSDDARKQ